MISMLAGFVIAAALWWALKAFAAADPRSLATVAKRVGGGLALLLGAVLALRGRFDMALLAGGVGAWLVGWADAPQIVHRVRETLGLRRTAPGRTLRSATLVVRCASSGAVLGGEVLAGPYAGRGLSDLTVEELRRLRAHCVDRDPSGVALIEAYLDGRAPIGPEHAEADPDARNRPDPKRGTMTEQEAHEVLGLQPGADAEAVRAAHRALMKKLHPDQGGTTYLASRINQAKDALLHRHR